MNIKQIVFLLMILKLGFSVTEQDIIKKYDECKDKKYRDDDDFLSDLQDKRDRDNEFYDEYTGSIRQLGSNNDSNIKDITRSYYALIIIMIILTGILAILVILSCLGLFNWGKKKIFLVLGIIFWIIYFAFFWAAFSTQIKTAQQYDRTFCLFYRFSNNLLYGNKKNEFEYIGTKTQQSLFEAQISEIQALAGKQSIYNDIVAADLPGSSATTWNKLYGFINKYKNAKTRTPTGIQQIPISNLALPPSVSNEISAEFSELDSLTTKMDFLAKYGQGLQNPILFGFSQQVLQGQLLYVKNVNEAIDRIFFAEGGGVERMINQMTGGGKAVFWIDVVLAFFMIILIFLVCFKTKNCKFATKIIIFICCLLLIGTFIALMFYMFASATLSGTCALLRLINVNNTKVLQEVNADAITTALIQDCVQVLPPATRTATQQTQDTLIKNMDIYFDAQTAYKLFLNKKGTQFSSTAIPIQVARWDQIISGKTIDHSDATSKLKEFNDLVKCGGSTYSYTTDSCTGINSCKGLYTNTSFSPPDCTDDKDRANLLYTNLKNYTNDTITNANNLKKDIGDNNESEKPTGSYYSANEKLYSFKAQMEELQAASPKTSEILNSYSTPYSDIKNCKVLRGDLLRFEYYGCYHFNYYQYISTIMIGIMGVFGFLALIFFCLASAREEGEEEPIKNKPYDPKPQTFYASTGGDDMVDLNDNEKVPIS